MLKSARYSKINFDASPRRGSRSPESLNSDLDLPVLEMDTNIHREVKNIDRYLKQYSKMNLLKNMNG